MLQYCVQVIVFQFLFWLVYEIILKRTTFFAYNRWYLLLSFSLSLILPLLKFDLFYDVVSPERLSAFRAQKILDITAPEIKSEASRNSIISKQIFIDWWEVTYVIGVVISAIFLSLKLFKLKSLFTQNLKSTEGQFRIIELPQTKTAFTFFKTIFLGNELSASERDQILEHEKVHAKQLHSLDLLFFEVFKVIFWFNPLVYVYQSKIAMIHEYLADNESVKKTSKSNYFQHLLNANFGSEDLIFSSHFLNNSSLKKRIKMIQKKQSRSLAKLQYLIAIPLTFAMLVFVANVSANTIRNKVSEAISTSKANKNSTAVTTERITENSENQPIDIPFAVVDQIPLFKGCEDVSEAGQKNCTVQKISDFVDDEINKNLSEELKNKELQRIVVQFKISVSGNVEAARARAINAGNDREALEMAAVKAVEALPQFIPGEHKSEKVNVIYSLPIILNGEM
ncbi:M56 family metallopeptidase [Zunongwangia profunda]|uniref:BlaR1 peptidase M56 n=2 Tax=Zunongwangia profunda TaxID=398743 RepID=A0A3D5J3Z0_9FLAO|nr:M56 family metallopeptidase [Zunongwangia profunda]MAC65720.1 blaR1 peptidase M56 [Flavobacteriaceae bacterium]HCV82080.1 blaR1 peptidase M56 [Zunongwangia profunda]|tara:strand:- start:2662 stop:4020 length:1359 start_codon:yes stop_codon:yes gene_type:complete